MVIDPGNSNVNKNGVGTASHSSKGRATGSEQNSAKPTTSTPTPTSDTVSLSGTAKTIGQLESKIADEPAVDSAKVASIKQAIEDGSFNVDSGKIADSMLSQDQLFS